MHSSSPLNSFGTPAVATPEAAAILASVPGIATVCRDEAHRLVCCNPAYSANAGRSKDELLGTTHRDLQPGPGAEERIALMRAVIEDGCSRDFLQFWAGRAWLCRVIPLDEKAYGHRGTLSVIMHAPVGSTLAGSGNIHVLDTAGFGALDALTPAEKRTIFDLAMGRSNNEIAERQKRSVRTIECHVRAIHEKLATSSRSAIIREASERGIQLFSEEKWDKMIGMDRTQRSARKKSGTPGSAGVIEAKNAPRVNAERGEPRS